VDVAEFNAPVVLGRTGHGGVTDRQAKKEGHRREGELAPRRLSAERQPGGRGQRAIRPAVRGLKDCRAPVRGRRRIGFVASPVERP
jgi:hypothetical protein